KIDITSQTIADEESVKNILSKLRNSGIDPHYWGNCQSALRAYLAFLQHENLTATVLPDEEVKFIEGACIEVKVNRFERHSKARAECIKFHKPVCKVCFIDFSK